MTPGYINYDTTIGRILESDLFLEKKPEERGGFLSAVQQQYLSSYKDQLSDDDVSKIGTITEERLADYRHKYNEPRYQPTQEELQSVAIPAPTFSATDPFEKREKAWIDWANNNITKFAADDYRSAEKEDIEVFFNSYANQGIRESAFASNKTSNIGHYSYTLAQGLAEPLARYVGSLAGGPEGAQEVDRFFAGVLPEDPSRKEELGTMIAAGIGDVGTQLAISATGGFIGGILGGPGGAVAGASIASSSYNIPRYMTEGFNREWERTGNESQSWDAAVSQIPAALLETAGDMIFMRAGSTMRGFAKQFVNATDDVAKRKVLSQAIQSYPKAAARGFVSEGAVGGIGSEWASGLGMAMATGNDEYYKQSMDGLLKSGLAEGVVGAMFGVGANRLQRGGQAMGLSKEFEAIQGAQDIADKKDPGKLQRDIFDALNRRDFRKVTELTSNKLITDPELMKQAQEEYDASRGLFTNPITGEASVTAPVIDTSTPEGQKAQAHLNYRKAFGSLTRTYQSMYFDDSNPTSELGKLTANAARTPDEQKRFEFLSNRKKEIEDGTYKPNYIISTNATQLPPTDNIHGPKNNPSLGAYQVTLNDGTPLEQGGSTFYLNDKKVAPRVARAIASLNATHGDRNISFVASEQDGVIYLRYQDPQGNWKYVGDGSAKNPKPLKISASFTPTKGSVPVVFNQDGDNVSFELGSQSIKDVKKIPRDFEVVQPMNESGEMVIRSKRNPNNVITISGSIARAVQLEDQERNQTKEEKARIREEKKAARKKEVQDNTELSEEEKVSQTEAIENELAEDADTMLDEEEAEVAEDDPSIFEQIESQQKEIANDTKVKPFYTLAEAEGKRGYIGTKRGTITKTEDGSYEFVFEDPNETTVTLGGANGTVGEAGVNRNVTNNARRVEQQNQQQTPVTQTQQQQVVNVPILPETKQSVDQVKAQLKQMLPELEDKIDGLTDSAALLIGNAINSGFSYESVSREEFNRITNSPNSGKGIATSIVDEDTDTIRNLFVSGEIDSVTQEQFEDIITEETFHGAAHRVKANNPELWNAATNEVVNDEALNNKMRDIYSFWDDLTPSLKTFEAIRAINQGRYNEKVSNAFQQILQKFLDYVNQLFGTSKNKNIQVLTINVEKFLGVERKGDRNALAVYNKVVRGYGLSEDDLMENRDIFRDVANMLGISTSGTKQDLIDRIQGANPVNAVNQSNETPFAEIVSKNDVANISIKGNYGAWVHPNGDLTKAKYPYSHGSVAKEIKKGATSESLISSGFVRVVNQPDKILVQSTKPQLASQSKRTLEFLGMNDEKNVIQYLPNGSEKRIYNHDAVRDIPFAETGDMFTFRLAPEFKNTDTVLGLKIANDGTLPIENLNAKIRKSGVNEFEIEKLTELVNELAEDGRVNIKDLSDVVDVEPTLVINKLDVVNDADSNYNRIQHEIETLGYKLDETFEESDGVDVRTLRVYDSSGYEIANEQLPENVKKLVEEAYKYDGLKDSSPGAATGRFGVDPYSNEQLEGKEISPGHRLIWSGDLSLNVPVRMRLNKESREYKYEGPKFESQHYSGDVAKNQLAFVRGGIHEYQPGTTLPNGTTAKETTRIMEIWEVQSDWASASDIIYNKNGDYVGSFVDGFLTDHNFNLKDYDKDISDNILEPKDTKEGRASLINNGYTIEGKTPLIKYWESLALKAAVNYAQKQGVSNIIVSDAETAMMTEGHDSRDDFKYKLYSIEGKKVNIYNGPIPNTYELDGNVGIEDGDIYAYTKGQSDERIALTFNKKPKNSKVIPEAKELVDIINNAKNKGLLISPELSQEKGMRAAYDQRVPNGLKKILGSKPKRVTVGIHNKAITDRLSTTWDDISIHKTPSDARAELSRLQKENPNSEYSMRESVDEETETQEWIITKSNVGNIVGSKVFKNPDGSPKSTNTGRMFAVPANKNVSREIPFAEVSQNQQATQQPTEDQILVENIPGVFGIPDGSISPERAEKMRQLRKTKSRKIEARMMPEEKKAFQALKNLKHGAMLSDESFNKYIEVFNRFVDTRRKTITDLTERETVEEILNMAADFKNEADTNMFNNLKETMPEAFLIDGKDMTFEDFDRNFDKVRIQIQSFLNAQDVGAIPVPTQSTETRESFEDRIYDMREEIYNDREGFLGQTLSYLDDVLQFQLSNGFASVHINKGIDLMRQTVEDAKAFYNEYINFLVDADLSLMSDKQVREIYYSLMGASHDSYMLAADNFVSGDIINILSSPQNFIDGFTGRGSRQLITNVSSINTQLRQLTGNREAYLNLLRLTSRFNESVKRSEMFLQQVMVPYQQDALNYIEKKFGRKLTTFNFIQSGMYAELTKVRDDETVQDAIKANIAQLKKSFQTMKDTKDRDLTDSANQLISDLDSITGTTLEEVEANARRVLGGDIVEYTDLLRDFFNHFEPMAKFTTEFVYGREYHRFHNYMPTAIKTLGKDGKESMNEMEAHQALLNMTHQDRGEVNINTTGMASTFDKTRGLGRGQVLELNINYLYSNRGRLNILDYFTSIPRREMSNVMRPGTEANKLFGKFIGDEKGMNGRTEVFNNAVLQSFRNVVESTQYIAPFHGLVNNIVGRWAGMVLSSFYQLPVQFISNLVPWMYVNIGNPGKMADFFTAASYIIKYKSGRLTDFQSKTMERLLFDLRNRNPDAVRDKNVELAPNKFLDWIKNLPGYDTLEKLDKGREWVQFKPFEWSDMMSGDPMLLTEYLYNLRDKTGNKTITFEDMTYDPGSYFAALDETERFIGIGNASRRGKWMNNKNALATVVRHMLTGFASHRVNNATNAMSEWRKIINPATSVSDKAKSFQYIAGIAIQSATFTYGKMLAIQMLMGMFKNMLSEGEEDEELVKLYNARKESMSADEKKLIDIEISKRREIRKVWNQIKQKEDDSEFMMLQMGKDAISNIFVVPAFLEFIPDIFIWTTLDASEKEAFSMMKTQRQEELKRSIKNATNLQEYEAANRMKQELSDLDSMEAVQLVNTNYGTAIPMAGMYGGALKNVESFWSAARDEYFMDGKPMNTKDFLTAASAFGFGFADMQRYFRIQEKLTKAEDKAVEKIENLAGQRN